MSNQLSDGDAIYGTVVLHDIVGCCDSGKIILSRWLIDAGVDF